MGAEIIAPIGAYKYIDSAIAQEGYDQTDWSEFSNLPTFKEANRKNAYQVYLPLEAELLEG